MRAIQHTRNIHRTLTGYLLCSLETPEVVQSCRTLTCNPLMGVFRSITHVSKRSFGLFTNLCKSYFIHAFYSSYGKVWSVLYFLWFLSMPDF